MITLTGKLIEIAKGEKKNRDTGEITPTFKAEFLHKVRGKSEIIAIGLDPTIAPSWEKAIGRDVAVEVAPYLLQGDNGRAMAGFVLADRKALPNVLQAPLQPLPKAA